MTITSQSCNKSRLGLVIMREALNETIRDLGYSSAAGCGADFSIVFERIEQLQQDLK